MTNRARVERALHETKATKIDSSPIVSRLLADFPLLIENKRAEKKVVIVGGRLKFRPVFPFHSPRRHATKTTTIGGASAFNAQNFHHCFWLPPSPPSRQIIGIAFSCLPSLLGRRSTLAYAVWLYMERFKSMILCDNEFIQQMFPAWLLFYLQRYNVESERSLMYRELLASWQTPTNMHGCGE